MEFTDETIKKLAHLARIEVNPEKAEKLKQDLHQITEWVEKLKEVDTSGVDPLIHLSDETNVLRSDKAKAVLTKENGLKNAPKHDEDNFLVPQVLKK